MVNVKKSKRRNVQTRENPETVLTRQLIKYLQLLGIPAWRNNTGAVKRGNRFIRFGHPGSADILGCMPPDGRLLAIEVKMPGRYPSPKQRNFLAEITRAGGIAGVVRSLEDLETLVLPGKGEG